MAKLPEKINICLTVNSRYIRYTIIMLTSLYENNENGSINLYVVQRDFTDDDKRLVRDLTEQFSNTVEFIWADPDDYKEFAPNFLREILFRLKIPSYITEELDRVLMLDVDLVVNGNLRELYEMDFEDCCFAAAPNMLGKGVVLERNRDWYPKDRKDWTHYNTGVLLWNLKKLRSDYPKEFLMKKGLESGIVAPTFEEELINILFGEGKILPLRPEIWNYIPALYEYDIRDDYTIYGTNEELLKKCRIIHFAQLSPWNTGVKTDPFRIWWDYAKKTPYYLECLEEIYWATENYLRGIPNREARAEAKLRVIDLLLEPKRQKEFAGILKAEGCSKIIIYGAGRIARFIDVALRDTDVEIVCYVDKTYQGEFCNRPEIKPEEIGQYDADIVIVANSAYYDEVSKQLAQYTNIKVSALDRFIEKC